MSTDAFGAPLRTFTRRLVPTRADRGVYLAGAVCGLLVVAALFAPLLAPYHADSIDIYSINQGPSATHLLGTDSLGRDIFSRLLVGARLSLLGPALVTLVATSLGVAIAVAAAWRGGWLSRIAFRVLDVLFAFPSLLFAVLAVVALGTGLVAPVLALAVAYTPYIARIVHSVALRERQLPYIEACQLAGFSSWRTSVRHLLRNIRLFVIAQATITFGYALLDLAAISFIGLGVQPPTADWGLMVSDGASALVNGQPQESLSAGLAIVITVVAFNILGERVSARAERAL